MRASPGPVIERALLRLIHPAAGSGSDWPADLRLDPRDLSLDPQVLSLRPDEWQSVLDVAAREQVLPLLARAMSLADAPPPVREAVGLASAEAAASVAEGYAQLAEVLRHLRGAGVAILLLKGAALARFTYAHPSCRPFIDLDLLVREDDIDAAHQVLRAAGYSILGGAPTIADRRWRHGRAYFDAQGLRRPVDLHWRYAGYPHLLGLDYDAIFSRARAVTVDGEPVSVPAPADMVVALAIALLREIWYGKPRLRYLRDLAEVVWRQSPEWDEVLSLAHHHPLVRPALFLGVGGAASLFGPAIPHEVMRALRPRRSAFLSRALLSHLCRNALRDASPVAGAVQIAALRALDEPSALSFGRWVKSLVVVPSPLAQSQRRWREQLWEG